MLLTPFNPGTTVSIEMEHERHKMPQTSNMNLDNRRSVGVTIDRVEKQLFEITFSIAVKELGRTRS
jgi:hypothetical protein